MRDEPKCRLPPIPPHADEIAALTGAVLLLAADLAAQLVLEPVALPVGVVTTAIGGGYLLWLVTEVRQNRLTATPAP